jgi:hypothetical protein
VAQFLAREGIGKARIYDYNATVMAAFAGTGMEVVITIPNEELEGFQEEEEADKWVKEAVAPAVAAGVNVVAVSVGAEVPSLAPAAAPLLLPAMANVHTGLTKANLSSAVRVTTAHSMAVLAAPSFPPSSAAFNASLALGFIKPILDFLKATGSVPRFFPRAFLSLRTAVRRRCNMYVYLYLARFDNVCRVCTSRDSYMLCCIYVAAYTTTQLRFVACT